MGWFLPGALSGLLRALLVFPRQFHLGLGLVLSRFFHSVADELLEPGHALIVVR